VGAVRALAHGARELRRPVCARARCRLRALRAGADARAVPFAVVGILVATGAIAYFIKMAEEVQRRRADGEHGAAAHAAAAHAAAAHAAAHGMPPPRR
jgi:hypothetical protein